MWEILFFTLFLREIHVFMTTFLETVSDFFPSDEVILSFFENETESVEVKKGELISTHDSLNRNVYFVEKGLVRSFYYEGGKDITTNFYSEGRLFANIDTLFDEKPTKYTIEAIEDTKIAFCNYLKLEKLCDQSLSAANFSRYILGKLMTQMADRIASLQYMTAKEKYAKLMEEHPDIILRAPLGMIATYLGISQETLSRIRSSI